MNCDCKYCDPWMMTADSFSAQNHIRGFNPDSTTHSSGEPVIECDPSLPDTTSKEEEVQDHIVSSSESEVDYSSVEEDDEEDELPLFMSIMKDDIDVLVTQFQQQMYRRLSKVMSEMVKIYHK